jgi:cytochrome oxidase assembly protein ShyY1
MLREYSFRPRGWALALAAAGCGAFIALGNWQSHRADEKRLADKAERIAVTGQFVPERTVLLGNRLRRGQPGYEVVTPLRIAGSQRHVLVDRGWLPAVSNDPQIRTPAGELRIEGLVVGRLPHVLEAGTPSRGRVRQNLDRAAYAAETGLQFDALILEQTSPADDGLSRDWPRAEFGPERHEAYALQWYSLAALSVALVIVLSFRRVSAS